MLRFLNYTLPSVQQDLILDEELLLESETSDGGDWLRIWERSDYAIVMGVSGKEEIETYTERCARDGVPIFRRKSGGGTVVLGPGCLLYSMVLKIDRDPFLRSIRTSYQFILNKIIGCLANNQPEILNLDSFQIQGISDLTWKGRKFSGNAQHRKQSYILHHGTILYNFDLNIISHYLREPNRQPEYRQNKSHKQFLCNLPINRDNLLTSLQSVSQLNQENIHWDLKSITRESLRGLISNYSKNRADSAGQNC